MKKAILVAVAVVITVVLTQWKSQRDRDSVVLAHSLETISLCANGLNLLDGRDTDRVATLLDHRLRSAIETATSVRAAASAFDSPMPNLNDALRRAAIYADRKGDRKLSAQIASLQSTLGPHLVRER